MSNALRRSIEAPARRGPQGGIDWDSVASSCGEIMRSCQYILNKYKHELRETPLSALKTRQRRTKPIDNETVERIELLLSGGMSCYKTAEATGVSQTTVTLIKLGKRKKKAA